MVTAGDTTFTVADVPGLIEGASEGRGLGHDFLRHVERCAALVHVIDTATMEPGRDPLSDLDVIEHELASYGGLEDRPRLVVLNKVDVPDGRDLADIVKEDFDARGLEVMQVSATSHEGLRELSFAMAEVVARARAEKPVAEATRIVIRPRGGQSGPEFTVRQTGEGWRVRGTKPERWVRQTDFTNDEAVGFLADRLNRLGVEDKLLALGAEEGDTVLIGEAENAVVFDFRPMVDHRRRAARPPRRGRPARDRAVPRPCAAARSTPRWPHRGENETRADVARRLGVRSTPTTPWCSATTPTGAGPRTTPGRDAPEDDAGVTVREQVAAAARVVVKVGSSSLTTADGGIDPDQVRALVDALAGVRARGAEVVLVSSGAIAAGPGAARPAAPPGRPGHPAGRRRRSARGCWCTATTRSSPGTASSPARCCSPSTT